MLSYLHRFLFAILIASPFIATAQVSTSDSLALVDLYNSTKGTTWNQNTNWLTTQPVSSWYGVTVAGNRVTSIVLNDNNLRGFLPGTIGSLTGLVTLNVSFNIIKGSLPVSIGKLSSLTGLYISGTLMGGPLPTSVGNLSNLVVFEAATNAFSGPLPPSIGKLSKLTRLNLYQNAFSDSIPSSLGNLSQLTTLILSINAFSGSIPSSITKLTNLADFEADVNQLTGSLPSTIGKMTALQKVVLTQNQLTGSIPASLCKCRNLGVLDLRKNKFSGSLPDSIGKLSSLYWLFLTDNRFSGSLPQSFGQLQNLKMAFLENNRFSGSLPDTIRNCTMLNDLRLSRNKLTGTLPAGLAQAPALAFIELNQNGFTGDIPLSYFDNSGISSLLLDNNQLSASQNFNNNFTKQIGTLSVVDNKYNFDGLEFIAQKVFVPYYFYQPPVTIHPRGSKLAVTAGGTLSNNTYTWQNIDTKKSVVIKGDSTFAPAANGRYTVDVTNAIAINLTLHSDTFDYKASVAAPVIMLSVSPNPARDMIVLSGLPAGNHTIAVTDLSGLVKLQVNSGGASSLRINISLLQKGNYYIKMMTREVVSVGAQFIKQ